MNRSISGIWEEAKGGDAFQTERTAWVQGYQNMSGITAEE